jgi:hypothetical protein
LFDKYPEYYNFFKVSLKLGREVILDNSIFELGKAFEAQLFAEWVERLQPTYYIVPDVLQDCMCTMENFVQWEDKFKGLPGKKIGVVQGKTYQELVDCYRFMGTHADMVAISFDYDYYEIVGFGSSKAQLWASGRPKLIKSLKNDCILNPSVPIHLLGCSLPYEFRNYADIPMIRSIDTSNPVLHGMYGIKYGEHGLFVKHMVKMAEVFEKDVTSDNMGIIEFNINKFKEIVHGK